MRIARKRFGQNFLTDNNVIDRIVNAVDADANDRVVEIGPGHGALTHALFSTGCDLTLIEIDRDLSASLRETFPKTKLINKDVMKIDFATLGDAPMRVVGNLPYNISTPLLFKLLERGTLFTDMFFMLQLEVVDRMTAKDSTKAYGRLSVMTQLYCQAEKLFDVPPEAFSPRPKVQSAMVRLTPRSQPQISESTILEEILISAFSARRKTLRNALKKLFSTPELESLGIDPSLRPENLTVDQFAACAAHIASRRT